MAYTIITSEKTNTGTLYHFVGTSSDTKPAGTWVGENSEFKELDTGDTYFYDNPTTGWVKKIGESGGSSGGGSYTLPTASASTKGGVKIGSGLSMDGEVLSATGAGKFTVTFTESNGDITADKTIAEIIEAKEAGDTVVGIYTSFDVPFEIPCITAVEMQFDGETAAIAAFAGPIGGEGTRIVAISGIPDGNSDEWVIDFSDFISSVSYNDLNDKPFYEQIVSPGINYQIPYTDGSNADKSYSMSFGGTTVSAYLYRVGDALTASQLEGATIGTVSSSQGGGSEASTVTVTSNKITEVTDGRYVMSDGLPLVFVADTDDVGIDIQDIANFKHLDAGTYLIYIDTDNFESGSFFYSASLWKAAVTTVYKLNAKFYDSYPPLIVTMEDKNGLGQYNGDKTYGEVYAAYNVGRNVIVKFTADDIDTIATVAFATYDSQNAKPYDINCVDLPFDKGAENDYLTFTMS